MRMMPDKSLLTIASSRGLDDAARRRAASGGRTSSVPRLYPFGGSCRVRGTQPSEEQSVASWSVSDASRRPPDTVPVNQRQIIAVTIGRPGVPLRSVVTPGRGDDEEEGIGVSHRRPEPARAGGARPDSVPLATDRHLELVPSWASVRSRTYWDEEVVRLARSHSGHPLPFRRRRDRWLRLSALSHLKRNDKR
jgi:hypothetical protein